MLYRAPAFFLAFFAIAALAQTEIQVPDQTLLTYLLDRVDGNDNGRIEQEEALTLLDVSLRDAGVTDLTGLEAFTKLETLDLSGNEIADVAPLAELPNLALIMLRDNRIRGLSPLLEKDSVLGTGTLQQRPMIDVEGNYLSSGDCGGQQDCCQSCSRTGGTGPHCSLRHRVRRSP